MNNFSAIIITRNRKEQFLKAYSSVLKLQSKYPSLTEIIVIDNASDEPVIPVPYSPSLKVIRNERPQGISVNRNIGMNIASTPFYLFLDDDAYIEELNIGKIEDYMQKNTHVGLVAPNIYYPDGRVQESVRAFPTPHVLMWRGFKLYRFATPAWYKKYIDPIPNRELLKAPHLIDWAIGACMIIRAETVAKVGDFDENYIFGYEDADMAMRMRKKGYAIIYWPNAKVIHSYARESSNLFSKAAMRHASSIIRFFIKSSF